MRILTLLCVLALSIGPAPRAWSQAIRPIDVAATNRFTARVSKFGGITRALSAPDEKVSNADRRAIADTLVAIAVASHFSVESPIVTADVIEAFVAAANSSRPANRALGLSGLRELVNNPSNQVASSVAVAAYLLLDDKAEARKNLRETAISRSLGAFIAVRMLATGAGEAGRDDLRLIALRNLAVQPQAIKEADNYARVFKWK